MPTGILIFVLQEKTVVWGSFSEEVNRKCFHLAPEIPLLFGIKPLIKIVLLFYLGLLPFFPIRESYLEIPMLGRIRRGHDSSQRYRFLDGSVCFCFRRSVARNFRTAEIELKRQRSTGKSRDIYPCNRSAIHLQNWAKTKNSLKKK